MSNYVEPFVGYWHDGKLEVSGLKVGQKIRNKKEGPPYMVVHEQIQSVYVSAESWPGRLWRVRVTELGDMSNTMTNIYYMRAVEIELIEELPIAMLFGEQGDKIVPLLNQITVLESLTVDKFYESHIEKSITEAAYGRAWEHWNENLKYPRAHTYNSGNTIASPSRYDQKKSPINGGFYLISDLIRKRARELDGDEAFVEDVYYGEVELVLNPRWGAACDAFLYQAMALSMKSELSHADFSVLTQAWRIVFE